MLYCPMPHIRVTFARLLTLAQLVRTWARCEMLRRTLQQERFNATDPIRARTLLAAEEAAEADTERAATDVLVALDALWPGEGLGPGGV